MVPTYSNLHQPGWAYQVHAENDAVVVDILRKAGAVLYVKTQNPQSLLVRTPVLITFILN